MALVAISSSAIAYLVKPLLDEIFVKKDLEGLSLLPYLIIAAYLAKGGGSFMQAYFISYIGKDIVRRVRDRLLAHMMLLDLEFFYKVRSGELISRLINDINRIQAAASSHVATILRESMTIIGLIVVIIYQSPKLAFYALVVLPLAFYPLSILAKKMKKISFRSQEKTSDITSLLTEIFNNIEIIKANNKEEFELKRFSKHNSDFFKLDMKSIKVSESINPLMELLGSLAAALVIIIGGYEVIEGNMSVGAFFSFMAALFMLYTPIRQLSSVYNKFQDAIAANERINQIFEIKPKIVDGKLIVPNGINEIVFKEITLYYGSKIVLKNINLIAKKGELIAIIGQSGAGKSSFINLLLRFFEPTKGEILIDNQNINSFELKSLRQKIGIVTQRVYIFNDTIANNVSYGDKIDYQRVKEALRLAGILDFVESLKDGVNTILEEFGTNLSGGQRQKIAIARALYKDPEILIFDEATSALDIKSEEEIIDTILALKENKIIFVISHKLNITKYATKIALFKNGEIVCFDSEDRLKECDEFKKLKNLV